jgi:hypothetical protein
MDSPEVAGIVYEDKATQNWCEFVVERSERIMDEVKTLIADLNNSLQMKEYPAMREDCAQKTGRVYGGCEYREICPSAQWVRGIRL